MNKKICIYHRPTFQDQESIDSQVDMLKNFAEKNNLKNAEIFIDNEAFWPNLNRKSLKKLLILIKNGEVSMLIVKNSMKEKTSVVYWK